MATCVLVEVGRFVRCYTKRHVDGPCTRQVLQPCAPNKGQVAVPRLGVLQSRFFECLAARTDRAP
ncbi:hypothetical protein RvY_09751 [Ramazzottius varieornatus]|uniref:Uncharacterized protein n=1 Tax=Ramazzottius varieornatus TaxID=947166 RepID=A0A1D1VEW8_RAMVA|nr:hypothetical protein RvY_09751 [Ramazzottius varieornatus]